MAVDFAIKMLFYTDDGRIAESIAQTINSFLGKSPFCGAEIYEARTHNYGIEYSTVIHAPQDQGVIKSLIDEIENFAGTEDYWGQVEVYELDVLRDCVEYDNCERRGYTLYELGEKELSPFKNWGVI